MTVNRQSIFEVLSQKLKSDEKELEFTKKITEEVFPVIDQLKRNQILSPVVLKIKLSELKPEYRDSIFGLCRIAVDGGPKDSIIVLDPEKVLFIISEIELEEENKKPPAKKYIVGLNKRIAKVIMNLIYAKLAAMCHLVNDLVVRKIINVPNTISVKSTSKAVPLFSKNNSKSL